MNHPSQLIYREGLNVGYRYFETYSRPVLFPFGYGLSYTTFAYSSMTLSSRDLAQGDSLTLSLDVTNTGTVEGAEVVQIYVRDLEASVHRPALELRDFGKTEPLPPGASQTLHFVLPPRAFAFYDVAAHDWYVEPGAFEVLAAAAVNDARLTERVEVSGAVRAEVGGAAVGRYETLSNGQLEALGVRVRPPPPPYPLHRTSLVKEVAEHGGCFGRLVYRILLAGNRTGPNPHAGPSTLMLATTLTLTPACPPIPLILAPSGLLRLPSPSPQLGLSPPPFAPSSPSASQAMVWSMTQESRGRARRCSRPCRCSSSCDSPTATPWLHATSSRRVCLAVSSPASTAAEEGAEVRSTKGVLRTGMCPS
jgi:hypothetical protein